MNETTTHHPETGANRRISGQSQAGQAPFLREVFRTPLGRPPSENRSNQDSSAAGRVLTEACPTQSGQA